MAQLMPLPLTVSCFSKIQIGFTFLVPAHLGSPGKRAVKRVCVCVLSFSMMMLMPLPLTVSCLSKIQIGFTFLVPAHLGSPGKRAIKRVCVCVCVCVLSLSIRWWHVVKVSWRLMKTRFSRYLDSPKIGTLVFLFSWPYHNQLIRKLPVWTIPGLLLATAYSTG